MNFGTIAQELQLAGFRIDADRIKNSGRWESVATMDNKSGRKSGRYIIGENICSWVNNKTQETGSFVLDQDRVISRYELDKNRRKYAKAERDKYFINALEAKKKYDGIKTLPSYISAYLERKGCNNFGGKIDENGNFIMPLRSLEVKRDGSRVSYIRSLQTILPDGTKLLETGCEKKGNMHIVGYGGIDHRNPENFSGEILIAEGYATAVSIHMATGKATVVAVDAGNLDPVLEKLTKAYPKAKFTICADNDLKTEIATGRNVGVEAALACQKKYACSIAIPEISQDLIDEGITDFNDIHNKLGLVAVREQIANILNKDKQLKGGKYLLIDLVTGHQSSINTNLEVIEYFRKYDKSNVIQSWLAAGKVEAKERFHFLDTENPIRLNSILNQEFGTDVTVEITKLASLNINNNSINTSIEIEE